MDRNTIIGLVMILAILVGFSVYNRPSEQEQARQQFLQDSIALVEQQQQVEEKSHVAGQLPQSAIGNPDLSDSAVKANISTEYGVFASGATGTKSLTTIQNDKIKVQLSNLGAKVYSVELIGYERYDSLPLMLFSGDSTVFGFGISAIGKSTNQIFFTKTTESSLIDATTSAQSISYRLCVDSARYIEYTYTLKPGEYTLKYDVQFVGLDDIMRENYVSFTWDMFSPQQEHGRKWENDNTTIHYNYFEDEDDYLTAQSDEETEELTGRVKWVAFKQQFFSSAFIADDYFMKGGVIKQTSLQNSTTHLKQFDCVIDVPIKDKKAGFKFYFGPNHFPTLKAHGDQLERLLPLGWGIFGWVNQYLVIPIFNWLSTFLTNYGLIILLLTIIIKLILFPLTYKSYLSTARMRVLKPEVDELNAKYSGKDQMMKRQQETMAMYRKAGVNPMGGCLPMLVQMPILFAMFKFFPASIELRHESFLWASDLSTYDSIYTLPFTIPLYGAHISLFTLLMAGSMILITQQTSANMVTAPGQPNMKVIMWMMPVMMLLWFNNYSSGLSYYYFIANMITFGQTYLIRAFVNDDAILAKIHQHKAKPVKKSGFQQRLEKMAKDRGLK